jgi:hypothetical protein
MPDVKLVDGDGAFVVGESFPCIFVDGHGPFQDYQGGDASKMGWLMQHSDPRFEDHGDFYSMVLNMIQQEDYHRAISDFPNVLLGDFQTCARLGNSVLSTIQGTDGCNTKLVGKLAGMVLRLGQPNLYANLQLDQGGKRVVRVFSGYNKEFDELVGSFPDARLPDKNITAIRGLCAFHDICQVFVSKVIRRPPMENGSQEEGLFGKVNGYVGKICGDIETLVHRGSVPEAVRRVQHFNCQPNGFLLQPFTERLINPKTYFRQLFSDTGYAPLSREQRAQTAISYNRFYEPQLATPEFRTELGDFYALVPQGWSN